MKIVRFINSLFSVLLKIYDGKGSLSKKDLLLSYLKLRFVYFIRVKLFKEKILSEKLMGYKINFFQYPTLMYLFEEIFINQPYYFETNTNKPVIFDCGSNIGMAILYLKKLFPQSSIKGFEPDGETFKLLRKNISENNLSDVQVYNCALSDKKGKIYFYTNSTTQGSLNMSIDNKRSEGTEKQEVDTHCLSEYITGKIDYMKMDIEGAENMVMKEVAEKNKISFIRQMAIEYHHFENKPNNLGEFLKQFESNNFRYKILTDEYSDTDVKKIQDIMIYAYSESKS